MLPIPMAPDAPISARPGASTPLLDVRDLRTHFAGMEGVVRAVDGVDFSIDSGEGLRLEKNLTHDPTQRGFVLELVLRNTGADPGGQVVFTLLGPALVNPPEVSLLGTSSVAIADTGDGAPKHVGPAPGAVHPLDVDLTKLSFAGNTNRFFGAFLYPLDEASRASLVRVSADTVPARTPAAMSTAVVGRSLTVTPPTR